MSRYEPLAQFLNQCPQKVWKAGFDEIEAVLGFALPASAYRYPAWWANQRGSGHSQTNGWKAVGWMTSKVDLVRQEVTFERREPRLQTESGAVGDAFAVRGAIEFLIGLGGSMPDYQPAPRN
jgi:hypothetical protein